MTDIRIPGHCMSMCNYSIVPSSWEIQLVPELVEWFKHHAIPIKASWPAGELGTIGGPIFSFDSDNDLMLFKLTWQ